MGAIEQQRVDVLIVGAGPTGLTLACDLARRGLSVRIVEKNSEPFRGSRGKGLQPRTLEVFEDLGVIDAILARGSEYPRMKAHFGWLAFPWSLIEKSRRSDQVPFPNPWLVPQALTEQVLRERLEELGGRVEFGVALSGFEQDQLGVSATLARGDESEQLRASFLVGADGGRSFVRKRLGLELQGTTLDEPSAIVGDLRVAGLDREFWHVWPRARGGAVALCPLPDGIHFQLFAQLPMGAAPPALELGAVQRHVEGALGRALRMSDPTWLSLYKPQARMVARYKRGRALLAGDAAHVHPPTGGQGLNMGVQDAYNLGWKLAAVLYGASESLLDSYEEERLPIARGVLGLSTDLYQRGAGPQRRGDSTKQLGMHYRERSLSVDLRRSTSPVLRAGDRAPDARCTNEKGAPTRLFELYRGAHGTALAFGAEIAGLAAAVVPAEVRVLSVTDGEPTHGVRSASDTWRQIARSYGARPGDLMLVRPDGYLGLCVHRPDAEQLRGYLSRCFGSGVARN